eukprot:NODE_12679_length_1210_cov_1.639889.p1 GENE.NODE_12679_length_1210_cov_1.639889~~NODE_12679_length_1210_cov_1.639889.p1  ORF type:complete len:308 (-),score=50.46 NODE_12679_length_1210_cov_1.639889:286-1209(-)
MKIRAAAASRAGDAAMSHTLPTTEAMRTCVAGASSGPDVAFEVGRFMDHVREEVAALMVEAVQKAASYCAKACAESIIVARSELQRSCTEERKELQRLYGLRPRSVDDGTTPPQSFSASQNTEDASALQMSLQTAAERISDGAAWTDGPLDHGIASAAYDSAYIDAHDAVQTLEERTHMASRAMELIEEALQIAEGGASPRHTITARAEVGGFACSPRFVWPAAKGSPCWWLQHDGRRTVGTNGNPTPTSEGHDFHGMWRPSQHRASADHERGEDSPRALADCCAGSTISHGSSRAPSILPANLYGM